MLEKEFEFYKKNQTSLVEQYQGKYLVIVEEKVEGAFDTEIEAYTDGVKRFGLGKFLLHLCQPGEDNYSQTFNIRVTV
jgi:hypothetical protein